MSKKGIEEFLKLKDKLDGTKTKGDDLYEWDFKVLKITQNYKNKIFYVTLI